MTDLLILAGGSGRRLGGVDKAGLNAGSATLLEHVLAHAPTPWRRWLLGTTSATAQQVPQIVEEPSGSGPAYALTWAARSPELDGEWLAVVAVDMPLLTAGTWHRLVQSLPSHHAPDSNCDVVCLVDDQGRDQPLAALYRRDWLSSQTTTPGQSMRSLLDGVAIHRVRAINGEARDVDTWESLAEIRDFLAEADDQDQAGPCEPARLD